VCLSVFECKFFIVLYCIVPNYTAWWQKHMCVNNLPKVVTRQCPGAYSNLRPWVTSKLQVQHITVRLPSHTASSCEFTEIERLTAERTKLSCEIKQLETRPALNDERTPTTTYCTISSSLSSLGHHSFKWQTFPSSVGQFRKLCDKSWQSFLIRWHLHT